MGIKEAYKKIDFIREYCQIRFDMLPKDDSLKYIMELITQILGLVLGIIEEECPEVKEVEE